MQLNDPLLQFWFYIVHKVCSFHVDNILQNAHYYYNFTVAPHSVLNQRKIARNLAKAEAEGRYNNEFENDDDTQ